MDKTKNQYELTRWVIQRSLAFVYLTAFLIAAWQFLPLLGNHGITPLGHFLKNVPFHRAPSLFYLVSSDSFILATAWTGVALSVFALIGLSESCMLVSVVTWSLLWVLYLSFVNAGQRFYGFGWEMLLLETGFLAIFLGSRKSRPPVLVIWLYRWLLFRIMLGAGLIKIRGDECWRNLTCMDYHYQTQPLANPLSWTLHKLPSLWHKWEVLSTHFIELVLPFAYFVPSTLGGIAGLITILFHVMLIFSGNLSWLNYITIVSAFACFDDRFFHSFRRSAIFWRKEWPERAVDPMGVFRKVVLGLLAVLIGYLSIAPARNLLSPRQAMNASFNPLHLVNAYGAFGSVTRDRNEIIFEGTEDPRPGAGTVWREYEFKCKPGDVRRAPCVVSPYHYKIDWQMWFAAMGSWRYNPWILNFTAKLLRNDPATLSLIANNPFPEKPPVYIRATLYRYRFTTVEEKKKTGAWWARTLLGEYLPPLSLDNSALRDILKALGISL